MYIWDLDFVKVLQLNERGGLNCKVEERMSVPLLATWPAMEEREKEIFVGDILVEVMEVCGSVWK